MDRESFLTAQFNEATEVELPPGGPLDGESVYVRVMSGRERDKLNERRDKGDEIDPNCTGYFVSLILSDEKGKRLLTDEDIPRILELPSTVLDMIIDAGLEINKLRPEDVEDAEKN
jgi:hypothetical protein